MSGTVTSIDLQTRNASIEITHPETGRTLLIEGYVPPECDIRINGMPVELSALRVGDQAEVEGTLQRGEPISVNWVRVQRLAPATEPATSPSAEGP